MEFIKIMSKQPKVAIVLLNFNEEEHTTECLESLDKIDYKNYEVIVVDNGSSKESLNKIKQETKARKNTVLMEEEENKGFTGGNNAGIKKAMKDKEVEFLLLLNNDTVVGKNFLDVLVNFAEKNKNVGVVTPQINKYSNKNEINEQNLSGRFNLWFGGGVPITPKNTLYETDYNSGCCWLVPRKIVEETGMFKEGYFIYKEEVEWAYRIKQKGYSSWVVPSAKIYHKGEATTGRMSGFRQYHETKNSLFFVREHGKEAHKIFLLFYTIFYRLPKNLLLNLLSRNDINKKNKMLLKGIKEGILNPIPRTPFYRAS